MTNSIEDLKDFLLSLLNDKKASNITTINLTGKTDLANYMIFANGNSTKNISAIAEFIASEVKTEHGIMSNIEGLGNSGWVIVDCIDIIVHLFHPETRNLLKAEEIWLKK